MCLDSYPSGPFVQTVTNDSHAGVLFNLVLPETPPWCNKLPFHDKKMVPECIAGLADYKKKNARDILNKKRKPVQKSTKRLVIPEELYLIRKHETYLGT